MSELTREEEVKSTAIELLELWGYEDKALQVRNGELPTWDEADPTEAIYLFREHGLHKDFFDSILEVCGIKKALE